MLNINCFPSRSATNTGCLYNRFFLKVFLKNYLPYLFLFYCSLKCKSFIIFPEGIKHTVTTFRRATNIIQNISSNNKNYIIFIFLVYCISILKTCAVMRILFYKLRFINCNRIMKYSVP